MHTNTLSSHSTIDLQPRTAPPLSEVLLTSNFPPFVQDTIRMLINSKRVNTVEDILLLPSQDLKYTGLNAQQLSVFLSLLSGIVMDQSHSTLSTCMSLAQNYENHVRLNVGHPVIDMFLHGGILPTGITEIVGESSSGKTQLCLQLLLQVQLPIHLGGLAGDAIYLTTESELNTKRLSQMIDYYKEVKFKDNPEVQAIQFFENIFSSKVPNIDKLWESISRHIGRLLSTRTIKLIVIDSIAALFRSEYSRDETMERSKVLWTFANQLKFLSSRYHVPIIVTNQITSFFERDENQHQKIPAHQKPQQQHTHSFITSMQAGSSQRQIPSLGLAWSNCINTRLILSRTAREYECEVNYPHKYMVKDSISQLKEYISTNYERYKNISVFGENEASSEPHHKRMRTPGSIDQEGFNMIRKLHVGLSPTLGNLNCFLVIQKQGIRGLYCDHSPPSIIWTPQTEEKNENENENEKENENDNEQNFGDENDNENEQNRDYENEISLQNNEDENEDENENENENEGNGSESGHTCIIDDGGTNDVNSDS